LQLLPTSSARVLTSLQQVPAPIIPICFLAIVFTDALIMQTFFFPFSFFRSLTGFPISSEYEPEAFKND
jgi:hypothetical protein